MGDRNYILEYLPLWAKVIVVYLVGGFIPGTLDGSGFSRELGIALALVVFGITFLTRLYPLICSVITMWSLFSRY